jgi:DNA-binding CsgD family transcriptional regulator
VAYDAAAPEPIDDDETCTLSAVLQGALSARSQLDWSRWLQGEIQGFLPHHALLAAWGNFASGPLAYDIVTRNPDLSMQGLPADVIEPLVRALHQQWLAAGRNPVPVDTRGRRSVGCTLFSSSPTALVHGVRDHRGHYDCLYVFVGAPALASPHAQQLCSVAIPYIDTAFRQLPDRGEPEAGAELAAGFSGSSFFSDDSNTAAWHGYAVSGGFAEGVDDLDEDAGGEAGERGSALSARELEVMQWVRVGKTNPEIAVILHLSMFTVKNHMQRIYRKLDVLNRAQAVGRLAGGRMHARTPAPRQASR